MSVPQSSGPASDQTALEVERAYLRELNQKPFPARIGGYLKLSGPGWLQSAITLGGGSLAGSLFLGVVAGYSMLWLQPLAMILGIVMLSAIGYVTLSTGQRPFRAISEHVSPVLAWSWALATLAANMVWALPQYSLAAGVLQQNLLPNLLGPDVDTGQTVAQTFLGGLERVNIHLQPSGSLTDFGNKLLIAGTILVLTTLITWSYGSGHWGIRLYELILKLVVAMIVLSFIFVVIKLSFSAQGPDWGAILAGFVPDFSAIERPSAGFAAMIERIPQEHQVFWQRHIVGKQKDVMMAAFSTAVGINMTFLLPYSLLGRGWNREYRGLSIFDLATGMFIPFVLATSCVVIASSHQFYTKSEESLISTRADSKPTDKQLKEFSGMLRERLGSSADGLSDEEVVAQVSSQEKDLAAALVDRNSFQLAKSLKPLTGDFFANTIFGFGVLAMTLSTITILMLISGFVFCEMLGLESTGWAFRLGTLAAVTGALGPFVWSKAAFALAIPTSVCGLMLLPIAYWTFVLLINQKSLLGDAMPRGVIRLVVNLIMILSAGIATYASFEAVMSKSSLLWGLGKDFCAVLSGTEVGGYILFGAIPVFALLVHLLRTQTVKKRNRR